MPFEPYRGLADRRAGGADQPRLESALGESLLILGHHYQQDEVIRFADLRGDSLKLSQLAAASQTCRFIVFCGVHFMAETADILSRDEVNVYLPDMAAGCSMADMADLDSVEAAWADLGEVIDTDDLMPVTYINSTADLKAFCGRHGGIVCTSSNARAVLDWAFAATPRPSSSPTSTSAATPPGPWASRSTRWHVWDPRHAAGRKHGRGDRAQPGPALEGALLGPPDVQAGPRRPVPASSSRESRSWCIPSA